MRFNVSVLDHLGGNRLFENHVGLAPALLDVGDADVNATLDIAVAMHFRSVGLHRFDWIEDARQRLVFHLDESERLFRRLPRGGSNRRDGIAKAANLVIGQNRLIIVG